MKEYKTSKDTTILDKIQSYYIQQWLISSGNICGKHYSIMELSNFLKCDADRIRIHMRDQMLNTKIWDREHQEQLMDAIMGQQLSWLLEDRMEVASQVNVLRESQGNRYAPFVTSELNKALGLKLNTTTNLQSLLRSLSGSGSVNIFNQFNQQNNQGGISVEEAIEIVEQENAKTIDKSKELQYIEATYEVEEFPEVVATKQQGVDTSKEGLTLNSGELKLIADDYKGVLNKFEEDHHEIRREIELKIDRDADDPELELYPG
jgi:hypothetical protein